jgi:hypothetical protein
VIRIALIVLLLPALAACGSDGDKSDEAGRRSTLHTSTSGSSPSMARTPEAKQLSQAELKAVLPSLEDLPAGYSPSQDDAGDDEDSKNFLCGADFRGAEGRNAKASTDYSAKEGLSAQQMTFAISQYDSPQVVKRQLQQFDNVVNKCDRFTSDGDTYTLAPMSAGRIGERTVAVKMTTKSEGFDVTINVIVVGTGPSLVTTLSANAGVAGSTVGGLVRLTGETVDRYKSAAGIS